jgi:hypothetical protein
MTMGRPCYKVGPGKPAAELYGEWAASLAAASLVFADKGGTMAYNRGGDSHSPTRQMRVKIQIHSPGWRVLFFPLTDNFYIVGQLFYDLASSSLFASLASVLQNLSTPLHTTK